jgi:hypothetical protein
MPNVMKKRDDCHCRRRLFKVAKKKSEFLPQQVGCSFVVATVTKIFLHCFK